MPDNQYIQLRNNPPKLTVKKDAKELRIHIVSCMCDNKYVLTLKKNGNDEFKLSGGGFALSNFGFKFKPYEIEWAADEGNWVDVFNMINSGTSAIEKVVSR
jgi:hypothetical protein